MSNFSHGRVRYWLLRGGEGRTRKIENLQDDRRSDRFSGENWREDLSFPHIKKEAFRSLLLREEPFIIADGACAACMVHGGRRQTTNDKTPEVKRRNQNK